MAKPTQWDLEIIFVPDCQALTGAAEAGTSFPVCSLATFHTGSKEQTCAWAEIPHTPMDPYFQAVLRGLTSGGAAKGGLGKVIAGLCYPNK